MNKLLTIALLFSASFIYAQDLTGTWEGEFVRGTLGLKQPAKMVLEIVQVEGKMYGLFDLYPVDTRQGDKPNITYTVEGVNKPNSKRLALIQGRIVLDLGRSGPDFMQFIFEIKSKDTADILSGKWFPHLEPLNSLERGSGTFTVKRISNTVSERMKQVSKEKEILEKLEKQTGE